MKLVTVFSASGRPGLAQVRQLLLAGYKVRAVTRESKRLENFDGIEIVSADYNDPDSDNTRLNNNKRHRSLCRF